MKPLKINPVDKILHDVGSGGLIGFYLNSTVMSLPSGERRGFTSLLSTVRKIIGLMLNCFQLNMNENLGKNTFLFDLMRVSYDQEDEPQ